MFIAALAMRRRRGAALAPGQWLAIAAMAFVSGTLIGWTVENIRIESLHSGDWLRSVAWTLVALVAPVACAGAAASRTPVPRFAALLGGSALRPRSRLALLLGALMIGLAVLAMQAALGLDFDPRYRDFPFAPLTGSAFPFLALSVLRCFVPGAREPGAGKPVSIETEPMAQEADVPVAEVATAVMLGLSAVYIIFNESIANWQALWFCAGLLALASSTLGRARAAPS
jgi:glucan 1,3-beta-glucosidase